MKKLNEEKQTYNGALLTLIILEELKERYWINLKITDVKKVVEKNIKEDIKLNNKELEEIKMKIIKEIKEKLEEGEIEEL